MTADTPEGSPPNPYESPRQGNERSSAEQIAPPRRGIVVWVASIFIWLQCAGVLSWFTIVVIAFASLPGSVALTSWIVSAALIAIYAGIAVAQALALLRMSASWAGRVAVANLGMGIVWWGVGMCSGASVPWLAGAFAMLAAQMLASLVMFRWHQRLSAWDKQSGSRFANVEGYERAHR